MIFLYFLSIKYVLLVEILNFSEEKFISACLQVFHSRVVEHSIFCEFLIDAVKKYEQKCPKNVALWVLFGQAIQSALDKALCKICTYLTLLLNKIKNKHLFT